MKMQQSEAHPPNHKVFEISEAIFSHIFSFLEATAVGCFDNAVLQSRGGLRDKFLSQLTGVQDWQQIQCNAFYFWTYMNWLSLRQVQPKCLYLHLSGNDILARDIFVSRNTSFQYVEDFGVYMNIDSFKGNDAISSVIETSARRMRRFRIIIDRGEVHENILLSLARSANSLEYLSIEGCHVDTNTLHQDAFRAVMTHCTNLKSLRIEGCEIYEDCIAALMRHCKQLEMLTLESCVLRDTPQNKEVFKGLGSARLRYLEVVDCTSPSRECLSTLLCSRRGLEHVDIMGCGKLEDSHLDLLASTSPHLKSLLLGECPDISDHGLKAIANRCHVLEKIALSGMLNNITTMGFLSLCKGCRNIRDISLRFAPVGHMDVMVDGMAQLCSQLRRLSLSNLGITDASLASISTHCKGLKHLEIYTCDAITNAGLVKIADLGASISHLTFSGCRDMTDDTLIEIATSCRSLEYLFIVFGSCISDRAINILARQCVSLRNLELVRCDNITDRSLISLAYGAPNLQALRVNCYHNPRLSIAGFETFENVRKWKPEYVNLDCTDV